MPPPRLLLASALLPELTTNQKGIIAETAIIHAAAKLGVVVSRPLQGAPYDLILDLPVGLLRVQCKWAPRQGDVIIVRCCRCRLARSGVVHRDYSLGEID